MNIVLGVTGGIAAYKVVSLARLFVEAGHELHVVPTPEALRFVGQPTWEAISRNRVTTSVHEDVPEVRHVAIGQRADLVVIAPATANTLAKMAAGLADDLLGNTLLATKAPVLVAPAMHTEMWQHPATQHNVALLRERGVAFIGPESGRLTGNDSGPGRMSEVETIFARAMEVFAEREDAAGREDAAPHVAKPRQDLAGIRLLVSAGGTREPIDPVRYLGNRSSGRQGVAIAAAAAARGAEVTLVAANIETSILQAAESAARIIQAGSAAELQAKIDAEASQQDVIIMAAAVADYRVAEVANGKLRKEDRAGEGLTLSLVENPDILRGLVERRDTRSGAGALAPGGVRADTRDSEPADVENGRGARQLIVGFAAETVQSDEELIERGRRKLARKGCDLLAVNAVGWDRGFESSDNELVVLGPAGEVLARSSGSKRAAAEALLDAVHALVRAEQPNRL